ncbi:cysteine desulfurase [Aggregatilineales bacterium SYSU G02658]
MRNVRADFPILNQTVHGRPLVYLDNAATSQKPQAVIDAQAAYYRTINANVHRGIHALSEAATHAYEEARRKVAAFIHAPQTEEVIFTRNTTEGINLVANAWGRKFLKAGDAVLLTVMEHHSNLVPWQILRDQIGIEVRYLPVHDDGTLDLSDLERRLDGVKLVSFVHASNVLGTINPVRQIADAAHAAGAVVLVDGAQALLHLPVDVQALGCDFYAFSGHKMCGPTGIGVLWGRLALLEAMNPFLGGGDMIVKVELERVTYAEPPAKFEAGTPPIAEAITLGAAVDYLNCVGMAEIAAYEHDLTAYALGKLREVEGLRLLGNAPERGAVFAFTLGNIHAHDLSTLLDERGIAIRAGHHCAQPLGKRFGVPASARASLAFYNQPAEVDALIDGLHHALEVFHVS